MIRFIFLKYQVVILSVKIRCEISDWAHLTVVQVSVTQTQRPVGTYLATTSHAGKVCIL